MECKIVEKLIDSSVEHELNNIDHNNVENHLNECDTCKKYYLDTIKIDKQLKNLFVTEKLNKDVTLDVMSEIHQINKKSKVKPVILTLAASLLIMLCFQFNTEFYTFAEKLPFVGDLLDYFKTEDSVSYAKDNNYKTFNFRAEQNGYKLYIEDIFMDELLFSMQFSIEDDKGNALTNFDWKFEMTSDNRSWFSSSSSKGRHITPWQKIDFRSSSIADIPEVLMMNITVESLSLEFKNIEIKTSKLKTYETKIVKIEDQLETEMGTFDFESFTMSPSSMYINFLLKENDDYEFDRFIYNKLIDSLDRVYDYSRHTHYLEDGSISLKYDSSVYFEESLDYMTLEIDGISYIKHESIGKYDEKNVLGLQYRDEEDNEFTISKFEKSGYNITLVVNSKELLNKYDFPLIGMKMDDGSWESSYGMTLSEDRIYISLVEIEKLINQDIIELSKNQLSPDYKEAEKAIFSYCKEKYDIELDEYDIPSMVYKFNEGDEYMLQDNKKINERTYNFNDKTFVEAELFEFSFNQYPTTIMFDESYILMIDLD